MDFQKAERCSAETRMSVPASTFPPDWAAPAGLAGTARAIAFACVVFCAAARSPATFSPTFDGVIGRASIGAVWWASIVLAALPYVTAGAIAASLANAIPRVRGLWTAFAAMLSPGCDCSLAGFASAIARLPASVAGFSITWGAAAGPSALICTYVTLGDRMLAARVAGAFVAAALTATLWSIDPHAKRARACSAHITSQTLVDRIRAALTGVGASAFGATTLLLIAPNFVTSHSTPLLAALAGAALSPCSTADPVLARVLSHDRASQAAFMIAAQCIDIRQLSTLGRTFGWRRMLLAGFAGCAGCAAAAIAAR